MAGKVEPAEGMWGDCLHGIHSQETEMKAQLDFSFYPYYSVWDPTIQGGSSSSFKAFRKCPRDTHRMLLQGF